MFPTLLLTNNLGDTFLNQVKGGSGQLVCNFIVDSANGNGLGVRSLKGPGIAAVYMHTSSTPAGGNPNPAAGYALVKFSKGFSGYLSGTSGFVAPVSGTPINVTTGVTAGLAYVITSLGTTTADQWQLLGLPVNLVPAVGMAFIAPATVVATGTGTIEVQLATGSGVDHVEVIGDPNLTVNTTDDTGATMVLVFIGPTSSGSTIPKPVAPADGTVVGLTFVMTANPNDAV